MRIFRWCGATFVIFSMMFQGLAESWLWMISLILFLFAWYYFEKWLDEVEHREFWQDIAKKQSVRQREK